MPQLAEPPHAASGLVVASPSRAAAVRPGAQRAASVQPRSCLPGRSPAAVAVSSVAPGTRTVLWGTLARGILNCGAGSGSAALWAVSG